MSDLEVTPAGPDSHDIIGHMMQLYVHDFSELWVGTPRGDLEDNGRFANYPLEPYWSEPDHIPLLIRVGGKLAGFVLLNTESHSGRPVDRNVAEFFVARKYRRSGAGKAAAHMVFSRYPGVWEAAVARLNIGAQAFWRETVRSYPQVHNIADEVFDTELWQGPILRFWIRPGQP